jgi:hypothetical protein
MHRISWARRPAWPLCAATLVALVATYAQPGAAQSAARTAPAAARGAPVRLAMLELAFYGKRANVLEPGDSVLALEGTTKVREHLRDADGVALVDSATVATAEAAPEVAAVAGGKPCNVVIACAREVGRHLGVPWVVTGKVSKTSNLIWIFSGQLINVATGELLMDDEYELKGDPHDMVAAGARAFARRVVRKLGGEPKA